MTRSRIWKCGVSEGVDLAARVYELFRGCRDFEFRGQIQAAAVSFSNNIAEGYERNSNAEFIRFLFIAKGSCGEVRSQAYVARRVHLLGEPDAAALIADAKRLSKRIMKFIQVRRKKFD
jgi:four helix bundle protein